MASESFASWSDSQLVSFAAIIQSACHSSEQMRSFMMIEIIRQACKVLKARGLLDCLEDTVNKVITSASLETLDCKELAAIVEIAGASGWTREREHLEKCCLDLVASKEISANEACTLTKAALGMYNHDVAILEKIFNRLDEMKVNKKQAQLRVVLIKALSMTNLVHLEDIEKAILLFERMVQMARKNIADTALESTLNYTRIFLDKFQVNGIAQMQASLASHQTQVLQMLKTLQQATRSLQVICNYLKGQKKSHTQVNLPFMKKSLESILFRVKEMLQANNCLSAFWVGNLKHRAIDGTEVGSQITLEDSSQEDSSAQKKLSKDTITDSDPSLGPNSEGDGETDGDQDEDDDDEQKQDCASDASVI